MSNKSRSIGLVWGLSAQIARMAWGATQGLGIATVCVGAATTLMACADENDPKTWVKRLDDPAQRSAAVKRLAQFFEDTMTKTNKNREAPEVIELLGVIVEPMTKVYTAGNLDDKTRRELIKSLADMREPRAAPAMAKAFNDYEPGKNEEDVKFASQWTSGLASQGKMTDSAVIDALWTCFAKFQPSQSKSKSFNLIADLHDAVLDVKHPSYGPKATEKLSAPVDVNNRDAVLDQLQFWQKTSVQLIKELKYAPAVKPLVKVLLTPTKGDLRPTVNAALMVIPADAEKTLLGALQGTDAELGKLASEIPEKLGPSILADAISWISRPAGRDALLTALDKADNDTNRTVITQCLTRFPPDARIKDAFMGSYRKLSAGSKLKTSDEPFARPVLVQVSSAFYDPALTDWVLREVSGSKGDEGSSMQAKGLEAGLKLMDKPRVRSVGEMVTKYWTAQEKELFTGAANITEKCGNTASCYVAVFDEPVASTPAGRMKAIKSARMAATYGRDDTKKALLDKVDKIKDAQSRLALVEAIDYLSPKGDTAAADVLDKIVASDVASGNKDLISGDDAVVKVANRLRARALP
ncbi:hypothetical protein [Pendulispora albinea]|uniref:Uncharacterized protein n=1 Tax=Pendulispora albinea TaxID=2741071 RepID=A0ABZ2M0K2_9BACT